VCRYASIAFYEDQKASNNNNAGDELNAIRKKTSLKIARQAIESNQTLFQLKI